MDNEKKRVEIKVNEPVFIFSQLFINGKWINYEYKVEKHPTGTVRISEKREIKDSEN